MMDGNRFLFIDDVEEQAYQLLTNPPRGIDLTWWNRLNELIGGLRMNEFTVLSAGAGAGKTTLIANINCQVISQGHGAYICSAEVGNPRFLIAMYCALDRRMYGDGSRIEKDVARDLRERYRQYMRTGRQVWSRNDDKIPVTTLMEEVDEAINKYKVKFLLLDNLQFFNPIDDQNQAIMTTDKTIREFAKLVRRRPVHALLIAHKRKGAMDEESIKGSKTIIDEADNVVLMHRLTDDELRRDGFTRLDRKVEFRKIRLRGWNVGEEVFMEFQQGAYVEKNIRYGAGPGVPSVGL